MIGASDNCYLYKENKTKTSRIYHRILPNNTVEGDDRWNTQNKFEAGYLTKAQWQQRSTKWSFREGWMLESTTGEVEAL